MKILVIGGTQFFGRRFVDLMLEAENSVTILSRGHTPLPWPDGTVEHVPADRNDPQALQAGLQRRSFDAVFDNVAMNGEHVRTLLKSVRAKQYIMMSSGAVYHGPGQVAVLEHLMGGDRRAIADWTDSMKPLHEGSIPTDPQWLQKEAGEEESPYRRGKLEAECAAVQSCEKMQIPFTIFRPPQVEGPWDPTGRTEFFARRIRDGGGFLLPRSGRGRVFQKVFRDDLAEAVAASIDNSRARDRTYNVAQEEILSLERYLGVIADCLNAEPPELVECDAEELREAVGDDYAVPLPRPKVLDLRRAQRDLGFRSSPYRSWMQRTLEWVFSQRPPAEHAEEREREMRWIEKRRSEL